MREKFKHLTDKDRIRVETLYNAGHSIVDIAETVGVHRSTIYRELKRGEYERLTSDLEYYTCYSADIADDKYRKHLKDKGPGLKIGNNIAYANEIEKLIADEKYSPKAALAKIKNSGKYDMQISAVTLYSYIDKGIFLRITNKSLPIKRNRTKRKNKKVEIRKYAHAPKCAIIEERPKEIEDRKTFGHWEKDTVVGKRGCSKKSFLVLTERKTREEILRKLPKHTAAAVVEVIDELERKWGYENFKKVFKSITVDNGTEFAYGPEIEQSVYVPEEKRTTVYYCHPYSSWERGTNENNNRLVRRHTPKGTNFDEISEEEVQYIETWMNEYPRELFGWKSSKDLFEAELNLLGLLSA